MHPLRVIDLHRLHEYRNHTVRHLPVAGRAAKLIWRKRLHACVEGGGTFVERTSSIAPGSVWRRAAARATVAMSEANIPIDTIRKSGGGGGIHWCSRVRRRHRPQREGRLAVTAGVSVG